MNPKYPIYIVSKGRWKNCLTSRVLTRMNVPHMVVVEEQEFDDYATTVDPETLLVLPQSYLDEYDTCDDLGDTKSKGPGAARNFAWDHSQDFGAESHWVMDDNIEAFYRMNRNMIITSETGAIFRAAESFMDRYENVMIAGLNYESMCKSKDKLPAFVMNTRIYSCLLIRNDLEHKWRGRYNEDTDLSLRILKDGDCTIQFNAFLQGKVTTQRMRGGNSKEFYDEEGTKEKSQMVADLHPDVAEVVWKFNRWHHQVDYRPYRNNELVYRDIEISEGVNEFGMILAEKDGDSYKPITLKEYVPPVKHSVPKNMETGSKKLFF